MIVKDSTGGIISYDAYSIAEWADVPDEDKIVGFLRAASYDAPTDTVQITSDRIIPVNGTIPEGVTYVVWHH